MDHTLANMKTSQGEEMFKEKEFDSAFNSVAKVINFVDHDETFSIDLLSLLIQKISQHSIRGSADDYHNLSVSLANKEMNVLAVNVCIAGLEIYTTNIDLMADCIKYGTEDGNFQLAEKFHAMLTEKVNRKCWNWRCYTFLIDYYNVLPHSIENREMALSLVQAYKEALPYEEKAFMAECETYERYGEYDKGISALELGVNKCKMAPQCATNLAERYLNRGDFAKAIESSSKAIIGNAKAQSSVNIGAVFAYRGLARDALIHQSLLSGTEKECIDKEIRQAIEDLEFALRFNYTYANIRARKMILESYLKDDSDSEDAQMLQLLRNLKENHHDKDEIDSVNE